MLLLIIKSLAKSARHQYEFKHNKVDNSNKGIALEKSHSTRLKRKCKTAYMLDENK